MMKVTDSPFRAKRLHIAIGKHFPLFNNFEQHDSHEFLVSLLDVLDEDVNRSLRSKNERRPKGLEGIELHRFCHESKISELFHGFALTTIDYDCHHQEVVYDPFAFWTLPLPQGHQSLTFEECVNAWGRTERLQGDNMPFCEECGQQLPANHTQSVWRFAPILIIRFQRFKEGNDGHFQKNNVPISYPMKIDASKLQRDPKSCPRKYYLIAVVVHTGTNTIGHYTCVVKDTVDNSKWYEISDSYVRVVSKRQARPRDAYLLFYEGRLPRT
jgi:ubiquitin C-terminal hydrolase